MARIIDADTHFMEPLTVYRDYIAPARRDLAIHVVRDDAGWPWLAFRGRRLHFVDDHVPGRVDLVGERRRRHRAGEAPPPPRPTPDDAFDTAARIRTHERHGVDAAIVFPNLGLLWEDCLRDDVPALCANLEAYNTWMLEQAQQGKDVLYPVVQLTLRDPDWFERELARCAGGGIKLAMIGAHPVGDRSLAHPDLDRVWAAFQDSDVAACFHVSQIQRPFDPAWYALDPEPLNKVLDSAFLYVPPALAVASLIAHGKLEQFPRLRIGIVELSARWVPEFLLHLDGAFEFYRLQTGRPLTELPLRPSEYFRRQVRVNAFAIEGAAHLISRAGEEIFMWGSDYPHAEGLAVPSWLEYERLQPRPLTDSERNALSGGNAEFLLGL